METKNNIYRVTRLVGISALTLAILNACGGVEGPVEPIRSQADEPIVQTSAGPVSDARTVADLQNRFEELVASIDAEGEDALPVERVATLIDTAKRRSEQAVRPGSPRFEMAATEAEAGLQGLARDWQALQAERQRLAEEAAAEAARAEQERLAAEQAERERLVAEQAERERLAAERAEQERLAAERAERERREAAAQAEQERLAAERNEQQRLAAERAEQDRQAAERAEQERVAAERAEQERLAAELAEQERLAAQQAQQAEQAGQAQPVANTQAVNFDDVGNMELDKIPPPSAAEAARLGRDLTPVGAPIAGNADGTIPAWTGGITQAPAGYTPGDHHPDPFPGDQVAFVITPDNYQDYTDKLSPGQLAMFERYPTYRIPVYQTRRTASFPQRIYDATRQNATTGRLTFNGEGVTEVSEGFPFPFPRNAYHLMWNHKLKYKGWSVERWNNQIAPTASGAYSITRIREELLAPYFRPGNTLADIENILGYFFQIVEGPARLAGNILLVHETLNQVDQERQAWVYNPGQRRVRRAPNVAYDNPGTASDGLTTNDMLDMFNGALDRYTWHLLGKREMYVPYNAYKAHSDSLEYDALITPGHLNPDYLRYELHRVWVVEARLKEGVRHIHPRRTFYLDEDSYQILLTDHYDARGDLWRHSEAHPINYYDQPVLWSTLEVHHDLSSGRYIATGLDNQEAMYQFNVELNPNDYTPSALRQRGRR
jgi:hypothetical protein